MTVLLCFTTAVIRKDAIAAHYPGGLHAFAKEYAPLREDDELAAICCMSTGELGEIVAHIAATGFDVARHVAIGDRWAGALRGGAGDRVREPGRIRRHAAVGCPCGRLRAPP
jgi:hypothetical protein